MVEQENNLDEPRKTAEQVREQLVELITGSEFGSPQYLAVSDYFHLHNLGSDLRRQQKELLSEIEQPAAKMYWESEVRITEQQIALLKAQIYHHRSMLKGYDQTYTKVEMTMEDSLPHALRHDGERLFGEDQQQRKSFEGDFNFELFEQVHIALYDKSNE